jgi:hypothetical protein
MPWEDYSETSIQNSALSADDFSNGIWLLVCKVSTLYVYIYEDQILGTLNCILNLKKCRRKSWLGPGERIMTTDLEN